MMKKLAFAAASVVAATMMTSSSSEAAWCHCRRVHRLPVVYVGPLVDPPYYYYTPYSRVNGVLIARPVEVGPGVTERRFFFF